MAVPRILVRDSCVPVGLRMPSARIRTETEVCREIDTGMPDEKAILGACASGELCLEEGNAGTRSEKRGT